MDQMDKDAAIKAAFKAYEDDRTARDEHSRRRPNPYAEQRALWDAMWAAADFSWSGLADAAWEREEEANEAQRLKRWNAPADFPGGEPAQRKDDAGPEQASLQDYWRWIPNEDWREEQGWSGGRLASDGELEALGLLERVEGQLWHVLHSPRSGGSTAAKALTDAVLPRLALGKTGMAANLRGARAQGLDAIWRAFSSSTETKRTLHLDASLAAFDTCDVRALTFGDGARFRSATFGDGAYFASATFGDRASFRSATFGDRASFRSANFGDRARFDSATFGDRAAFRSATFGDRARFDSATFGNVASFNLATFGDRPDFGRAAFGDEARFAGATFGDRAWFGSATFGNRAWFGSATFGDRAAFRSATFGDGASFYSATFAGKLRAEELICKGRFQMRAAAVNGYADFTDARWPEKPEDQHAAFEGCRFRDVANFKTKDFSAFAMFDGAVFASNILLTEPVAGQIIPDQLFDRALQAARAAVERDQTAACNLARQQREWKANGTSNPRDEPRDPTAEERGEDARYGALAGGLRTLRRTMAAQSDIDREQRYYRYELKTRAWRPSEPAAAKFAARIYDRVSDYGASIGRPLLWLIGGLVFFAALYLLMGVCLGLIDLKRDVGPIFQAIEFSLTNTFRPLSALTAEGFRDATLGKRLLEHGDLVALIVRFLSIFQSLFSLILAFLFGLALRRRFQIS